jgi:predicted transcriptional regulator
MEIKKDKNDSYEIDLLYDNYIVLNIGNGIPKLTDSDLGKFYKMMVAPEKTNVVELSEYLKLSNKSVYRFLKRLKNEGVIDFKNRASEEYVTYQNGNYYSDITFTFDKFYVYKFINKEERIIYIGKTNNIKNRISQHLSKGHLSQECYNEINHIEYAEIDNKTNCCLYEVYYINKYKPKYNKRHKYEDINIIELPELSWKTLDKLK